MLNSYTEKGTCFTQGPRTQRVDKILQQTAVTSTSDSASITPSEPPLTFLQPELICLSTMSTFHFCPVFEQRRPILSRPVAEGKEKTHSSAVAHNVRWPVASLSSHRPWCQSCWRPLMKCWSNNGWKVWRRAAAGQSAALNTMVAGGAANQSASQRTVWMGS